MKKRSVTIHGHATSLTLEDEFWTELVAIANKNDQSIASLIQSIDDESVNGNLSSAVRIYILKQVKEACMDDGNA